MKETPFTALHIKLGAKMQDFAGYNMPMEYTGIIEEHLNVVENVGVFDVSHMGEIWVKGPKALEYVQRLTSNDASKLVPGKAQYSCFVNEHGGIKDDFITYCCEPDKYMLVVNAANIVKDWNWCVQQNTVGAELENGSEHIAQLAVQGPNAKAVVQKLTDVNLDEIPFYSFKVGRIAGADNVIISNTGYTGAGGFELYFYPEYSIQIWNALFDAGKEFGIRPTGLGARDTLRQEMGFLLYGNDMNEDTSPLECGLGWITKFADSKPFIGRDVLEKQKSEGITRKLVCFELKDKGVPRHGYEIVDDAGTLLGNVTSGTMSPCLHIGIGMGYVPKDLAKVGTEIFIKVRNRLLRAEIVKAPFRKKN